MSATNKTTNYGLPLFIGTDKPTWLGDWNNSMTDIDIAIAAAQTKANTAQSTADTAQQTASTAQTGVNGNTQAITNLTDVVTGINDGIGGWEKFSFTNPNQSIFTAYNVQAWRNKKLGVVNIFGVINTAAATNVPQDTTLIQFPTNFFPANQTLRVYGGIHSFSNKEVNVSGGGGGTITIEIATPIQTTYNANTNRLLLSDGAIVACNSMGLQFPVMGLNYGPATFAEYDVSATGEVSKA